MFDAGCRPLGRLFYSLAAVMMISGPGMLAGGAAPVPQSGPATTTIADAVAVNVPSQGADFNAVVRRVSIDLVDSANDRRMYAIEFANDSASPLGPQDESSSTTIPLQDTRYGFLPHRSVLII